MANTYLTKYKRKGFGRFSWVLTPPDDILEAGLVNRKTFHDGRTAKMAERLLKRVIADFRSGKLAADVMPEDPTFNVLSGHYLNTSHFNSLSSSTMETYRAGFVAIGDTPTGKKLVGQMRLSELNSQVCSKIYDHWIKNYSVPWANEKKRLWGVLFSHAMSLDLIQRNPMANVKAVHHEPETTLWTREQVEKFLDVAFSDFKYRSVGLLAMLCYEFCQRPVDIANLRWYDIDFEDNTITIKQRKRGATVHLPMSDSIRGTIIKQKEDFDFQPYVLPYLRPGDKAWRPMTSNVWSRLVSEVRGLAGIPPNLYLRGLRTTGITEMVAAGVDSTGIMPVTGHKNLQSINPYMRHTRAAAKRALDTRRNSDG